MNEAPYEIIKYKNKAGIEMEFLYDANESALYYAKNKCGYILVKSNVEGNSDAIDIAIKEYTNTNTK